MSDPDDYEWDGPLLTESEDKMLRDLLRSEREKRKLRRWFRLALIFFGFGLAMFLGAMLLILVQGMR